MSAKKRPRYRVYMEIPRRGECSLSNLGVWVKRRGYAFTERDAKRWLGRFPGSRLVQVTA